MDKIKATAKAEAIATEEIHNNRSNENVKKTMVEKIHLSGILIEQMGNSVLAGKVRGQIEKSIEYGSK